MTVSKRPATEADREFARAAHHAGYYQTVLAQFGQWDEADQDRRFDKAWQERPHSILLHGNEPCGYCAIEQALDHVHLTEFVIHPDYYGQGIGSAAFRMISEYAAAQDMPLNFRVLRENSAVAFYKKNGASEVECSDSHIFMRVDRPAS